jgi:hypothetical protein
VSDATSGWPGNDDPGFIEAETAQPVDPPEQAATRSERARNTAYGSRFTAVYLGLALVAGIGVGAFLVTLMRPDKIESTPMPAQFKPLQKGELGARELAGAMQRKYLLPNGNEFVEVLTSRNTLQDGQGGYFRVRYQSVEPKDATGPPDTRLLKPASSIHYDLCGSDQECALPGEFTPQEESLLRREGLELAVRTFRNDSVVDNVAVFLNPAQAKAPWAGYALVFDRKELQRAHPELLENPLGATLPDTRRTLMPSQLDANHAARIDSLTLPYLYLYRYKILGGRDALMQLQPTNTNS